MELPRIQAVFAGKPKSITDADGSWVSSIYRDPVVGPIEVLDRGFVGDSVAQPYHGSPDAAVCAHLMDHYTFWNDRYGMRLVPGMVGENITIDGIAEDQVCAGDVIKLGSATLQVSGPRIPCVNLARRIGRPDWARLTIQENRTGLYLRVLQPGHLEQGNAWLLQERWHPEASIPAINHCIFQNFDAGFAERMLEMSGVAEWWKEQARQRLSAASVQQL